MTPSDIEDQEAYSECPYKHCLKGQNWTRSGSQRVSTGPILAQLWHLRQCLLGSDRDRIGLFDWRYRSTRKYTTPCVIGQSA